VACEHPWEWAGSWFWGDVAASTFWRECDGVEDAAHAWLPSFLGPFSLGLSGVDARVEHDVQ